MLQQEKDIRTRVEILVTERSQRMQQMKALVEEDQDLCDILCSQAYAITPNCVPSMEQLDSFRRHISNQMAEKVTVYSYDQHRRYEYSCFRVPT